jgi:valyl-tRNA synthetase
VKRAVETQKTDFPDGIEECGTDALRFALVAYTTQAQNINLDIKRVVAYRHWCNKLWNAIKFAMMNLPQGFKPLPELGQAEVEKLPAASRWLLSRLNDAITTVVKVRLHMAWTGGTIKLSAGGLAMLLWSLLA